MEHVAPRPEIGYFLAAGTASAHMELNGRVAAFFEPAIDIEGKVILRMALVILRACKECLTESPQGTFRFFPQPLGTLGTELYVQAGLAHLRGAGKAVDHPPEIRCV
jgi:hypothetical protein